MKTLLMRVAAVAAVLGVSSLGYEATAGFRHLRLFRSSCAAPSCAGCYGPVGCHAPMMSCGMPACWGPAYVTPPMMMSACSAPGCSVPMWSCSAPMCSGPACGMPVCSAPICGGPSCYQPMYAGGGYGGYGPAFDFDPGYGTGSLYGTTGPAMPFPPAGPLGAPGFRVPPLVPEYYAPMTAEYAPIPPAPAADIVW